MNPAELASGVMNKSIPRESGDEPFWTFPYCYFTLYSPRERG